MNTPKDDPLQTPTDFLNIWCHEYGLPLKIKMTLTQAGLTSGHDLLAASNKVFEVMPLSNSELQLLRNAREQYGGRREIVDEIIDEKIQANREAQKRKAKKLSKQMVKKKCPTENDVMKERLRVRKERKSVKDGEEESQPNLTLAEKLMAARNMSQRSTSMPVCSPSNPHHAASRSTQSTPAHYMGGGNSPVTKNRHLGDSRVTKNRNTGDSTVVAASYYTPEEQALIKELSHGDFHKKMLSSNPPLSTTYVPKSGKMEKQGKDMKQAIDRLQHSLFDKEELELLKQIEQQNG